MSKRLLALVLSPGTRITYLGISGDPQPAACLTSAPLKEALLLRSARDLAFWLLSSVATYLHLDSSSLQERELIIAEPATNFPSEMRHLFSEAGLIHVGFKAIMFVPAMEMACLAMERDVALIVDVGYDECVVGAVAEGGLDQVGFAGVGLRDVDSWIGENTGLAGMTNVVEDLRATLCFAPDIQNKRKAKDIEVELKGLKRRVTVRGEVRTHAINVLFAHSKDGLNRENGGICQCICAVLKRCSLANRSRLVANIIISGGGAMMPGFGLRLIQELKLYTADPTKGFRHLNRLFRTARVVHTELPPVNLPWIGASVVGRIPGLVEAHRVTKVRYLEIGRAAVPELHSIDS